MTHWRGSESRGIFCFSWFKVQWFRCTHAHF
jgi:hypothetical protein